MRPGPLITVPREWRWAVAAGVVLVLVASVGVSWLLVRPVSEAGPRAGSFPSATAAPTPGSPAPVPGSVAPGSTPAPEPRRDEVARGVGTSSRPVTLDIPAIDVVGSPLGELGLNPDETVEVPTDYAQAGWFDLGPTPGEVGAAVILGHVDSTTGPAVFFRLRFLQSGDLVDVGLADGRLARFAVGSVETYPKADFPARRVYTSNGSRDLRLVTCGGEFDRATGRYQSNVVAYASLIDILPA